MDTKRKSFWNWLNPMTWIDGFFRLIGAVFGPLLRLFGLMPPPCTEGFENIEPADIADAETLALEQEAAIDELSQQMSPAEIVRAYAKADAVVRATMDLSGLGFEGQCWLLGLSDEDLAKLSMSTTGGCARSLEQRAVLPSYAKPQPEMETAEILVIPTEDDEEQMNRDFVSARFRELFHAPGVPNPKPRFVADTLH